MPETSNDKNVTTKARFLGKQWDVVRKIKAAKALKPDILILSRKEQDLVAKDFRDKGWAARYLWGPLNLMYEKFLLNRLTGVTNIPQVIGLEDYNCLLISRIDGEEIKKHSAPISADYFDKLLQIADKLHARGVLHLDLGHKSNIMVDKNGAPAIIDFNSSLYLPPNAFFRPLIRLLAKVDKYAILRLKIRFRPQDSNPAEKKRIENFLRLRKFWIFDKLLRKLTNFISEY
ncbi:MAG: hypothetical protein JXR80_06470 [Deltaproteobacteria bacterium]|nr:hypothetical protein [Deltaproteobacteria bacterium]